MEAERINAIANRIADLSGQSCSNTTSSPKICSSSR